MAQAIQIKLKFQNPEDPENDANPEDPENNENPEDPENNENPPSNVPIPNQVTEENPIDLRRQMEILFSKIIEDMENLPDYDNPKIKALRLAINKYKNDQNKLNIEMIIDNIDLIYIINYLSYFYKTSLSNPSDIKDLVSDYDNLVNLVNKYKDKHDSITTEDMKQIINYIKKLPFDAFLFKYVISDLKYNLKDKSLDEEEIIIKNNIFHSDLIALNDPIVNSLMDKITRYHLLFMYKLMPINLKQDTIRVQVPVEKKQSIAMKALNAIKSTIIEDISESTITEDINVCCVSVDNQNPNPESRTAVLYFPGFSDEGGIDLDIFNFILNNIKKCTNYFSNISKFIMVQWPGIKLRKLDKVYESDKIEDSPLALVEQDMAILKNLKEQNGGRLHLVGFSWGGLRAMNAYLSLTEEDRKGISLSLLDPFIPTLTPGRFRISKNLLYVAKSIMSKYVLNKTLNKLTGNAGVLLKHCWAEETNMRQKLEEIPDKTLDIRGIYLMGKGSGFARSKKYVDFFKDQVLPKCLKAIDKDDINSLIKTIF